MGQVHGPDVVAHGIVTQPLISPERLWAEGDDAARCLKVVVVIERSEVSFVADIPVEFGEEFPVITTAGALAQVGVDDVQRVRNALQVDRVEWVRRGLCLRDSGGSGIVCVGRRQRRTGRHAVAGLIGDLLRSIHGVERIFVTLLLIIEVKEHLVVQDGAADVRTKLLQYIDRLGVAGTFVDGIVGSGAGVAVVVKGVAMEGVGAGLRHRIDEACAGTAIPGVVHVGLHLELFDCVQTEEIRNAGEAAAVSVVVAGGVDAIHGEAGGAVRVGRAAGGVLVAGQVSTGLAGEADVAKLAIRGHVWR